MYIWNLYIVSLASIFCSLTYAAYRAEDSSTHNSFYTDEDVVLTDYNLFDTFEGYTWHKYQHSSEENRQFYIHKQAEKEFLQLQNITFDIDIIHIDGEQEGKVKPKYESERVYPAQDIPRMSYDQDGKQLPSEDMIPTFRKDMQEIAANVFRQGHSLRTYSGLKMFPYRDDNVPRLQKQLFYSTTVKDTEQSERPVKFNFRFNINSIEFNSKLNEHVATLMKNSNFHNDFPKAITRDYQVNKRQYAFYLMNCFDDPMKDLCNSRDVNKFMKAVNREYGNQMFMGIVLDDQPQRTHEEKVIEEIERLLNNFFADVNHDGKHRISDLKPDPNRLKPDMTQMFKKNLQQFIDYLKNDLGPKMEQLQGTYYQYRFDSPLNFIMVKSDFKSFFESFTQAKLSLLYSLELHKDSMFAIQTESGQGNRQQKSLEMSGILYKNFEKQVEEMHNILEEYHHLLEHDNFDCSTHLSGKGFMLKCWFKRYGFSLVCLALLGAGAYMTLKRAIEKERKRKDYQ